MTESVGAVAGVDVGGTFTDVVVVTPDGITIHKEPSTPPSFHDGFLDGLRTTSATAAVDGLPEIVVHGTTVATNAILEQRGARLGFLLTRGHRDVLPIGLGRRPDMYDLFFDPVEPLFLAPRRRHEEIDERIDATGAVVRPLDEESVVTAADRLVTEGVEAIVVVFLHAHVNPEHEHRAAKILAERHPDVDVTLSSSILPRPREYRRLVAAGLDAYVKPVIRSYVSRIAASLADGGAALRIMQSSGGVCGPEAILDRPIVTALSGPAAGVVAAARIAAQAGFTNAVTLDMGGTSTDISLVLDGTPAVTAEASFGTFPVNLPMVDVTAIGAGGSSVAFVDSAGGLHVGPRSAGAHPGPACYGKGGIEPTVTDAELVLGLLDASSFAGELDLDADAAREAIAEGVAAPLGIDSLHAASGVHRIVNASMANALRLATLRKGHDPRDLALVAFGGAGPVHATALARDVGIRTILIPPYPGVLSALGLLLAPVQHEATASLSTRATSSDVLDALDVLDVRLAATMASENVQPGSEQRLSFVMARYRGQAHELEVRFDRNLGDDALTESLERFHDVHRSIHGHARPEAPVDVVMIRSVHRAPPALAEVPIPRTPTSAVRTVKEICLDPAVGFVRVPCHDRFGLDREATLEGPAILLQADTTIVLLPGDLARVDELENLIVTVPENP